MTQSHYTEKVMKIFGHLKSTQVSTPFDNSIQLYENKRRSIALLEYSRVIERLMYAMTNTRPIFPLQLANLAHIQVVLVMSIGMQFIVS